jgi:hypothetical protein
MLELRSKSIFILFFFIFSCLGLFAQKTKKVKGTSKVDENKQKTFVTIGPELSMILPTDFGARKDVLFQDTMYRFFPNLSYRFGACLRFDFSKTFSFQTGIFYISRSYTSQVGKANPIKTEVVEEYYNRRMNYVGFEIPMMGLFYVQLGRKWFMNNAVGFSVDFFPSSIAVVDNTTPYVSYGGRNSWCVPAMKAAIGFEYRSDNAGYFYLGGQFHRPFFPIFDGFTERYNIIPYGYQSADIPQSGTYFSIDVKYFFPTGKKNKWTESNK